MPAPRTAVPDRERICTAMLELIAARDRGCLTLAEPLERAEVSRAAFTLHFSSLEDALKRSGIGPTSG